MKFDTVGVLRVLLGESQYLPDSRYRKYINTAICNILPEIYLSDDKRKVTKNRLFKYKNPKFINEQIYCGDIRTQSACVLINICSGYLLNKTEKKGISIYEYGQIKVISGMALRMISENKRRVYEN